jgi:WhiB family redox-sensing transcriptional regulator
MPEGSSTDRSVHLLPLTMLGPAAPALGEWHCRGLCIGEDPEIFFPSRGDPGARAREICTACPVRDNCLEYAAEADEFGVWGGLDQQERRNLKRKKRRQMAANRTAADGTGRAEGVA